MKTVQSTCLDENQVLGLLEGTLSNDERDAVGTHLDACETCRRLVGAAAARSSGSVGPDDDTVPAEEDAGGHAPSAQRGSTVSRYLILDLVGAGAMGVVYAAYDPELDRKVAVKVLRTRRLGRDESLRGRILREAQALARLTHPNVVTVHDVGVANEQVFIVMEFIAGTTLARWLAAEPRSWREVLDVFHRAGLGLAAAHAAGLVHRDFKPDNVLIGADGRVLVTDFGLARLMDGHESAPPEAAGESSLVATRVTSTGVVVGTPAYMAPEQTRAERVTARSDLFSFCVALYEALYRERPFAGATLREIHEGIVAGRVREPREGSRVPSWIRQIVRRGLQAEPTHRPASMDELLAALGRDPAVRWRRGLIAGALLLGAGLATFALWRVDRAQSLVCKGADAKLAGVWDADRKGAVARALDASGKPWAPQTWKVVEATLDRYTRDWVTMRTQACEATRVTREQSEALLDLRMRCLDDRLEQTRALTTLLATPEDKLIDNAAKATYGLAPLSGCADARALQAPVPLPSDPAVRGQVEALRVELAQVKALANLGRYQDGEKQAAALVPRARALGYAPLEAEALQLWSDFLDKTSDFARAEVALRDALWAAEAGNDRKRAARALVELVWIVNTQGAKLELAHEYSHHAAAMLRGLGGDAELEALLASNDSAVLVGEGHYEEAEKRDRDALALRARVFGQDHPQYGVALANVAVDLGRQDRSAEALAFSERALAVYEKALGQHHPLYGQTLFNIADTLRDLGRLEEARPRAEQALALFLEVLGPEHALVASAENVLGLISTDQHRYAEAVTHFERAVALAVKLRGQDNVRVGIYRAFFVNALVGLGRSAEALDQGQRAIAILTKNGGNAQLVAWIEFALGKLLLSEKKPVDALPRFERSLTWWESNGKSPKDVAEARLATAQALWESGGDRARARRLAKQAVDGYAAAGPSAKDDLDKAQAWLSGVEGRAGR